MPVRAGSVGLPWSNLALAFPDMHGLGDMLVASGFSDPVIDMEHLTLTYASFDELIGELRATCGPNAARGRPRGLAGKTRHRDLAQGYEALRHDGRLPATFEIVYGHAWQGHPGAHRVADIPAAIKLDFPRRKCAA